MTDPKHNFSRDPMWFSTDAGSLAEFKANSPEKTDPADWPAAATIERDVLIYDGAEIRSMDAAARDTLKTEWARVFLTGPGIVVIKGAYGDTSPVDRASDLFTKMIEDERAVGAGGGDHFAKPGANDRVWNALQKHCIADPEGFAQAPSKSDAAGLDRTAKLYIGGKQARPDGGYSQAGIAKLLT